MAYGIINSAQGFKCANCKSELVNNLKDGNNNFCSHCGNPLNPESVDMQEKQNKLLQMDVLLTIEDALPNYNIKKILSDLKEELNETLED